MAIGVIALVIISVLLAAKSFGSSVQSDPQRLFDAHQRSEGRRRCGGRCEHKPLLLPRCHGKAEQADHIYPWSKGGATSLGNLQYLCSRHNRQKSDHVPGWLYIWRLERRRRTYFPMGVSTRVAWRFGQTY